MGSVVGTGKAAFQGELVQFGVAQAGLRHGEHAGDFLGMARLDFELTDAHQVVQLRQAHGHPLSMTVWAATAPG